MIIASDITIRNNNFFLREVDFLLDEGNNLAILGENGSGKTTLIKGILGQLPVISGSLDINSARSEIGFVGFDSVNKVLKQEKWKSEERHLKGHVDEITSVNDYLSIGNIQNNNIAFNIQNIEKFSVKDITKLSTGEMRKLLILKALADSKKLLILDEPYDGLDEKSRRELLDLIESISNRVTVILITHRLEEIGETFNKVLMLKDGRQFNFGDASRLINAKTVSDLYDCEIEVVRSENLDLIEKRKKSSIFAVDYKLDDINSEISTIKALYQDFKDVEVDNIVEMKDVKVIYRKNQVLDNFNWTIKRSENWCLLGGNGAGKSTIVQLISADHKQRYANDIKILGHGVRDSSSIWDIKKRIGVISGDIHNRYDKLITALDVVNSGFFDSIGIYTSVNNHQSEINLQWIELLGIDDLKDRKFRTLSYGQQRLFLHYFHKY